ncbi:MAG: HAD family hydrolase [Candidatus Electrothrix aestuarii]|uniref:HAD family hydrolase n=1 Tax=Candidatus Electrothrix aestuarii TaxID=3062594 RepID=A0AAU8LXE7_9BACT|nr:HAD family hydrolase [Candidatus Electrothrix aestuarii]
MSRDRLVTWTIGKDRPETVGEYLLQQADAGVRYFCFDYFDTLVVREIEPEYTKQLAAKLHSQLLNNLISPEQLYALRQQLERELCVQSEAAGGELEFYLHTFVPPYRAALQQELGDIPPLRDAALFAQRILSIETVVERAVQQPCEESIQVLVWLRNQGMTTVLISDFYLPSPWFHVMLESMGIRNYFDHFYISADHGVAKSSGRLYQKVCAELGCTPKQMLMIGDNLTSDVTRPDDLGMQSLYLVNPQQKTLYRCWKPEMLSESTRVRQRFGQAVSQEGVFKEISTTLWYFTHKLLENVLEKKVQDVVFFSKEGEFLKKLFDRMQDDLFGSRVIRSHYLLVSRKATFLASLRPLAGEDFARLFAYYRDIAPRDFLLSLNFEESLARSLCAEIGIDYEARVPNLAGSAEFARLLAADSFQQVYEERRLQQRSNFLVYLDSLGIPYEQEGLTIVDVGWKGSIQDNVYNILEGRVALQGYFAGFLRAAEPQEKNQKQGLLFDNTRHLPHFNVYNNNRSLFEMMLGASHGSADGYFTPEQFAQLPDDHQREVRERVRWVGPVGMAGVVEPENKEVLVATLDLPKERKLFAEKIQPLQEQFFGDVCLLNQAFLRSGCTVPDPEWFARRHARMVFTPTNEEIEFFERLYHLENFGVFEYTDFCTDTHLTLKDRYRNFINMRKNPAILEMGTWPPIILRRLGLDFYRHINGYRRYRREFPS